VAGDFCQEMLLRGASKGLNGQATPVVCDGLQLPFARASFDAITVAFGVRNFEDIERGLVEMQRVLRPGGTLAVLEFFRSESHWKDWPFRFYFRQVLPRVGRLVSRDRDAYTYLPQSVGRFVTRREFDGLLRQAGFDHIQKTEMDGGIATLVLARRAAG
jgi:demethylmenaquinone methyltransferase/2-methoxy-6-polyprenyl-1,4-benzoquinol methylase